MAGPAEHFGHGPGRAWRVTPRTDGVSGANRTAWILVLESPLPIPVWLVVAAAARDPLIAGVPLLYTHRDKELEAHSRRLRHDQHPAPDAAGGLRDRRSQAHGPSIVDALVWAVLASILVSGALYVSVWGRKARQTCTTADRLPSRSAAWCSDCSGS